MQDNYSNIDDEFLESGWEHMRALLDKEMPVKDDRRAYFWFFTTGILAFSLIAFVIWKQYQPNQATPEERSAIPVASVIEDLVPVNTAPTGEKSTGDELLPIHETSITNINEAHESIEAVAQAPVKRAVQAKQKVTFEAPVAVQQVETQAVFHSDESPEIAAASYTKENELDILDETLFTEMVASKAVAFEEVSHIPGLQINQLSLNKQNHFPVSMNGPVKFRQVSPLSFGLQASYVLGNVLAYEGASVGLVSKFKLNRRFSLRSGFDLSFFKSQHNIKSWFRNNDNALVLRERIITKGSSSASEILKSVDKSVLLELPIELEYKLLPALSVSGGLKLGYLMNASGDNLHLSDDNPPSVKINDTYPLDEGFIQRPYLSVKTGAHYSLTDLINLDVSYTQSLGSFVSDKATIENEAYSRNVSNNRKNAFSYLSMGLSYDF